MPDEISEFEVADLTRILREIKASVTDRDWMRLEETADALKLWCQVVNNAKGR
ncbi:hypothetical protein ES708_32423 [subsurface metagenome]